MTGMSRSTGRTLDDSAHLIQSIGDILSTPIGSRVMRREYGSLVPELIDQPLNGGLVVSLYAAVVMALMRWEPRLRISRVQLYRGDSAGAAVIEIDATRVDTNAAANLRVPLQRGAAA